MNQNTQESPTPDSLVVFGKPFIIQKRKVRQFHLALCELDPTDPQSLIAGIELYRTTLGQKRAALADAGFMVYLGHFYPWVEQAKVPGLENIHPEFDQETNTFSTPPELAALKEKVEPMGITFSRVDQSYLPRAFPGFLQTHFSSSVSPALQGYLEALTAIEKEQSARGDLKDSFTFFLEVGKALSVVGKQLFEHGKLLDPTDLTDWFKTYMRTFFQGTEQFPVDIADEDGRLKLSPELKIIYRALLLHEKMTLFGFVLTSYQKRLRKSEYIIDQEVLDLRNKIAPKP